MDACPQARYRCFSRPLLEKVRISQEQIAQHHLRSTVATTMSRRISRKVWGREQRRDGRINLEGPRRPIVKFSIEAADKGINADNREQRHRAGRPRWIVVQP